MGGVTASKGIEVEAPDQQKKMNKYMDALEKNQQAGNAFDGDVLNASDFSKTNASMKGDPKALRAQYMKAHSLVDDVDAAALNVNPASWDFPFENIVLEGGGNKGLAYVGVFKCFEDLGMKNQLKRFGGASAGAITATLAALGYSAVEILDFLSSNIEEVFMDHRCGYFSLLPNLIRSYGWNPGHKIYEWFGGAIEDKTGSPDTTFYELYKSTGIELCIVVTNVNLMTGQYCHPKTTPDMKIRDALRMTMAIPGVFSALEYDFHGQTDLFVDGGVLNNYPINCFDGWYLSMAKPDAFLVKLKSLSEAPEIMSNCNRFKRSGQNKTIGFLVYEETEREVMRYRLESRIGALEPTTPTRDTPLWLEKQKKWNDMDEAKKAHNRILHAVDEFLKVLHKHNIDDLEFISRDELKNALEDPDFSPRCRQLVFGENDNVEAAFDIIDKDGNGQIAFLELTKFLEERGVRMQVRFHTFGRREVENFGGFVSALKDALLVNMKYTAVTSDDEERTVGINTGHLGTMNYDLETEDRDFVVQRGYNATMSFLRYFVAQNPDQVKEKSASDNVQATQPTSIHDIKINC